MITFIADPLGRITDATLTYLTKEEAFNVDPKPQGAEGILLLGMLQLCVDLKKSQVLYVWGRDPYLTWRLAELNSPTSTKAALTVTENQLKPGIAVQLLKEKWPIRYADPKTGWVCIGNKELVGKAIEFAHNCIAVLADDGHLLSLWLRPKEFPKNAGFIIPLESRKEELMRPLSPK